MLGRVAEAGNSSDRHTLRRVLVLPRIPVALLAAGCGLLVLTASFANFLNYNEYPLARPEVGLVVLMLSLVAGAAGLVYWAAGRRLRVVLDVALAFAAFDLNFDGTVVVVLAAMVSALLLNRFLMPMLGMVAAFVLATEIGTATLRSMTAAAEPGLSAASPSTDLPVLVHLILDEHIGIEGLSQSVPEAEDIRARLQTFYEEASFRLFGGAFSQYMHTVNAIPQILNFGEEQPWAPEYLDGRRITENAYFDRLRELGYGINILQSDFLDYRAHSAVETCDEYRATDVGSLAGSTLSAGDKSILLASGFVSLSSVLPAIGAAAYILAAEVAGPLGLDLPIFVVGNRTSTTGALAAFDLFTQHLEQAQPGKAYFAHILAPHFPYAFDARCGVKDLENWESRQSPLGSRLDRELAYIEQLDCVTKKLGQALAALARSEAGASAIVIVHGDHGSRITDRDPTLETAGDFSDADMIATFSTLFAVRAPQIDSGYDARKLPVAKILAALAASGFRSGEVELGEDFVPTVRLENREWKPVRSEPLPTSWRALAPHS